MLLGPSNVLFGCYLAPSNTLFDTEIARDLEISREITLKTTTANEQQPMLAPRVLLRVLLRVLPRVLLPAVCCYCVCLRCALARARVLTRADACA